MQEEWKDIHGWEGLYQVSNYGEVRSCDRIVWRTSGNSTNVVSYTYLGKVLKINYSKKGYPRVYLSSGKKKSTRSVLQLVAEHFFDNFQTGCKIETIDGNLRNCKVSNLRYKYK